jgi:putative glutamine amidotransferase
MTASGTADARAPRIVVTVMVAAAQDEPDSAARRIELYAAGVRRHGGVPVVLDATAAPDARAAAFAAMDGLLLTGGADIHPSRYGHPDAGSHTAEVDRDVLESEAWAVAVARGLPVLGICRGFQAINVFSGGTLLQHVDGHAGPRWGHGPAATHPIRVDGTSLLGRTLGAGGADRPGADGGGAEAAAETAYARRTFVVNTYHHQAVRPADLAPGLRATAWAASEAGELIEAFEAADGRFVVGVQCHPERTESTPPAFEKVWAAFVDACRRSDAGKPARGEKHGPDAGRRRAP